MTHKCSCHNLRGPGGTRVKAPGDEIRGPYLDGGYARVCNGCSGERGAVKEFEYVAQQERRLR